MCGGGGEERGKGAISVFVAPKSKLRIFLFFSPKLRIYFFVFRRFVF